MRLASGPEPAGDARQHESGNQRQQDQHPQRLFVNAIASGPVDPRSGQQELVHRVDLVSAATFYFLRPCRTRSAILHHPARHRRSREHQRQHNHGAVPNTRSRPADNGATQRHPIRLCASVAAVRMTVEDRSAGLRYFHPLGLLQPLMERRQGSPGDFGSCSVSSSAMRLFPCAQRRSKAIARRQGTWRPTSSPRR